MLQFYFLSIACNLASGFALAFDALCKRAPRLAVLGDLVNSRGARLTLGISALIVGFIKLLVPVREPLVIGDLVPAVVGMAMGIALLFDVFKQDTLFPSETAGKVEKPAIAYRTTLGILGMAAAVLHFFLPERPFL